jgi:hypothetical protein
MSQTSKVLLALAGLFWVGALFSLFSERAFSQESLATKGVIQGAAWGALGKNVTVRYLDGEEGREGRLRRSPLAKNPVGEELPIKVVAGKNTVKGNSLFGLYGQTLSLFVFGLALLLMAFTVGGKKDLPEP